MRPGRALIEAATGRVLLVVREAEPSLTASAGQDVAPCDGSVHPDRHFATRMHGEWVFDDRPAATAFPPAVTAPFEFVLQPGETIRIVTEAGDVHTADAADDPLRVVDAGTLRVRVRGAFPARDWTGIVEVS